MRLRDYQQEIYDSVFDSGSNDIVQLDTGAGKTPIEAEIFRNSDAAILIAHRNVLIVQCSATIAKFSVDHDTVSSEFTRRRCMQSHREAGQNRIRPGHSTKLVASIDSLVSHFKHGRLTLDRNLPWNIIIDEAHHTTSENKWGMLTTIFPNARYIGFTATPGRMDGKSLSVRQGGVFNRLVQCKWLREESIKKLINSGHLCDYRLYTPPESINKWRSNGCLSIAGDPVDAYERYMSGRRAIVMCPAIKNAKEIADKFRAAGISSASISSDMSGTDVWRIITAFRAGEINALCNVDMIGEGFDVPGVDGLILCRFTKSYVMYRQWVGRTLRSAPGKELAVIVDLSGVVSEHGEPDENVLWDIDNPPKTPAFRRKNPCHECGLWYEADQEFCPECGEESELLNRADSVSQHYVKLLKLDINLIYKARTVLAEKAAEKKMEEQLHVPLGFSAYGIIGKMVNNVIVRFAQTLVESGVSIKAVNTFMIENENAKNLAFWTANFNHGHAEKMSKSHALKVFKKCQKLG